MITPDHIRTFERFLNLAENDSGSADTDYRSVYLYRDGNNKRKQVTLGRGFTEDGGNLARVVSAYLANGGTNAVLKAKAGKIGKGVLADDKEFHRALVAAATEQAMRDAQDEVFRDAYLNPALTWAESNGFATPLSTGVIVDSYLHSGSMPEWLMARFPEPRPSRGGNEQRWIEAYLGERLAWFKRATGPLRTCQFRPAFFLGQIAHGNWNLSCPLKVPGKGTIC